MKPTQLLAAFFCGAALLFNCENPKAGAFLGAGDNQGKAYSIGDDAMADMVVELAQAYSNQDTETLMQHYDSTFIGENGEATTRRWLESMDSISMVPYKVIPVQLDGSEDTQVLAWSKETRHYKNGSFEALDLMEFFNINEDGKVNAFRQWKAIDSANFGNASGGKFFGKTESEYTGRPLVFSNRDEVAIIEKVIADYNNMDLEGMKSAFAETSVMFDYKGNRIEFTDASWPNVFKGLRSVSWKPYAIVPLKIRNTDAASGVIVTSIEKRVSSNGKVWEKELVEMFYFNLEGKITSMTQYARDL